MQYFSYATIPKSIYFFTSCDMVLASKIMVRGRSCFISLVWETGGKWEYFFPFPGPSLSKSDNIFLLKDASFPWPHGQPMCMPSAQLGCQQPFWFIKDWRTPWNFTACLLFNLLLPKPKTSCTAMCSAARVQLCACILKKGPCLLLCVPYAGSRAGEGWGEAHTSQHSPLPLLHGLGCFLLLYMSFLGAANLSLHKNTPSRSICSESLTGNPSMLLLFSRALVMPAV